jgi:phosphoglycerol transferase MdoB-like AlkP superfamily enzyme
VAHLDASDTVKGYFAANLEFEHAVAALVSALEEKGIADDTVICISSDHFPYALDTDASLGQMTYLSELYGYDVSNSLIRDHNRLILWCGSLEDEVTITVTAPTSSLDVLPTLLNLFGIPYDSRLYVGRDVFSDSEAIVFNTSYDWKTDLGIYLSATGVFTPTNKDTVIPEGYVARMKAIVKNKVNFARVVLDYNYYKTVLPKSVYR